MIMPQTETISLLTTNANDSVAKFSRMTYSNMQR